MHGIYENEMSLHRFQTFRVLDEIHYHVGPLTELSTSDFRNQILFLSYSVRFS